MSDQEKSQQVLTELNKFRSDPNSFSKRFSTISKALGRAKKPAESKELEEYQQKLPTLEKLPELKLSSGLSQAAEEHLLALIESKDVHHHTDQTILEARCNKYVDYVKDVFEITDHGDLDNFITRILICDHDKERVYQTVVRSKEYEYIGIAVGEFDDDDIIIMTIAKEVTDKVTEDYGDDILLKEAFDLFDIYGHGKLDINEIKKAFEALGFDENSYSVYKAIDNMSKDKFVKKNEGCDWETFRDTVKDLLGDTTSKEGLRKLFDLFVDDPEQKKIALNTMRRVAGELEEDVTNDQLREVMKRAAENGYDIDFEEFYELMMNYNELHPEDKVEVDA